MSVIAVFARSLRPGVTFEQYMESWMPQDDGGHLADLEVAVDPADD